MADVKVKGWIEKVEETLDSQSDGAPLSSKETKNILLRIEKLGKAKPGTLAEMKLANRAMLLLCRLPHLLDESSVCILVKVVDSLIFQLLSMATSGKDKSDEQLRETGKSVLLVLEEWSQENRSPLLKGCVDSLSGAIINLNLPVWLRTLCIKGANQLLEKARRDEKGLVWERLSLRMDELFRFLLTCGVYDTQAAVVEFMFRILPKAERQSIIKTYITEVKAVELFLKIGHDFEASCRMFLNQLNLSLGSRRRVFSFPTSSCTIEGRGVFKPDGLEFWVDFNLAEEERGVAFYSMEKEGSEEPWQLEVLLVEDVLDVSLSFPTPKKVLVFISNATSGDIELTFEETWNNQIVQILRQMFGGQLKEAVRETTHPRTENSTTSKKQLFHSRMGNVHHDEAVPSPENTSIPPSEEEDGHPESLPCAQPDRPEYSKLCEQSPIESRPQKEGEWNGKSKAKVEKCGKPKNKNGKRVNAYSPVVTIGKIQAGRENEEMENRCGGNAGGNKKEDTRKAGATSQIKNSNRRVIDVDNEEEIEATPEMIGGPSIREDVSMTRSGGRKRAVRKLPECSRQKIKGRSKPIQLNFYDEAEVKETDSRVLRELSEKKKQDSSSEASTSRGAKAARGLKKMLDRVPKALGIGQKNSRRVSVSPSLGNISELSARGFLKRRASSILGKGKEKRNKAAEESNGAPESSTDMNLGTINNSQKHILNGGTGTETHFNDVESNLRPRVSNTAQAEVGFDRAINTNECEEHGTFGCDDVAEVENYQEEVVPANLDVAKDDDVVEEVAGEESRDEEVLLHDHSHSSQVSKAADAGNSFLRLAAPLLDILRQASTTTVGGDVHPSLREGWMAVKTAIADAQEK